MKPESNNYQGNYKDVPIRKVLIGTILYKEVPNSTLVPISNCLIVPSFSFYLYLTGEVNSSYHGF